MIKEFSELSLPAALSEKIPFDILTPIQAQAIPLVLAGDDVLATSKTGSGKTLAYGAPLIAKLMSDQKASAIILAPTRELATQIYSELSKLIDDTEVPAALLIGGAQFGLQKSDLRRGARLIIGTPGRVYDHLNSQTLLLDQTQLFVLDEADCMLDMGFGELVNDIAAHMPPERQTLMFSATLPPKLEAEARKLLRNPVRINAGTGSAAQIQHFMFRTQSMVQKLDVLAHTIRHAEDSTLVFTKTRLGAEEVATELCKRGLNADFLHAKLPQSQREEIMQVFRRSNRGILIATDIAARGIDVKNIGCVINFDIPHTTESYAHRVGRTGRVNKSGVAVTLVQDADFSHWRAICQHSKIQSSSPKMHPIELASGMWVHMQMYSQIQGPV